MITQALRDSAEHMWLFFTGISSNVNHSGIKGESREKIVIDFLKEYLPKKFSITSGIIINAEGGQSRQQDIIIYDAFTSPVLDTDHYSLIPIESVYATIEVKSKLTNSELKKAVENFKSVKELSRHPLMNSPTRHQTHSPAGLVFAFTADSDMRKKINLLDKINQSIHEKLQVSILSVLDKGSIFNVNKRNILEIVTFPSSNTTLSYNGESGDKGENLLFFYLFLITALNIIQINPPDMTAYASKSGIHSFKPEIIIPAELIKKDMYVNLKEIGVLHLGDIPQLSEYSKKFFSIIQDKELISSSIKKGFPEYFLFLYYTYSFFKQSKSLLTSGNYSFLSIDGEMITGFHGEKYNWEELCKTVPLLEKKERGEKLSTEEEKQVLKNFFPLFSKTCEKLQ